MVVIFDKAVCDGAWGVQKGPQVETEWLAFSLWHHSERVVYRVVLDNYTHCILVTLPSHNTLLSHDLYSTATFSGGRTQSEGKQIVFFKCWYPDCTYPP